MSIEESVTVSWAERLKQSVFGIGAGATLIAAVVGVLFWNEGRAVQTARSLSEGAGIVSSQSSERIDPAFNGKLVHVAGATSAAAPLTDEQFGLEFNGLRLERRVEMYQWVQSSKTEKTTNTGGSETQVTTYSYAPEWSATWHDSAEFKEQQGRQNPPMRYSSVKFMADGIKLGAYGLEADAVAQLGSGRAQPLTAAEIEKMNAKLGYSDRALLDQGKAYIGRSAENPAIGDYRISYTLLPFGEASVIGRQHETGIGRYRTDSGDALMIVEPGNRDAKDMFATAASGNASTTWILRVVAIVGLIVGFALILRPLNVLVSVLPFLGSIMGFGTGILATIMGISLGALVIAVAWFFHRPVVSLVVLAIAAAVIGGIYVMGKKRKSAAPQA